MAPTVLEAAAMFRASRVARGAADDREQVLSMAL
jgi:hypothetical protein